MLSGGYIGMGPSAAVAQLSGGATVGDLETGSVVGYPFKGLPVDLSFHAIKIGGKKVWYPPVGILNRVSQSTGAPDSRPVLLKVTNHFDSTHGFELSVDSASAGPTVLHVKITVNPGETKYIGIPASALSIGTAANVLKYRCHLHSAHLGGQLLVLR